MTGRFEIDGTSRRYGDVVALQEMTLEIRAGELFGFVGRAAPAKPPRCGSCPACRRPTEVRFAGMAPRSIWRAGDPSGTCAKNAGFTRGCGSMSS
jgi:hypothetical protein